MTFLALYLIIPIIFFLIDTIKETRFLVLFFFLICFLSYDNSTDFDFFYTEFQYYLNGDTSEDMNAKGREAGWMLLMSLFSFEEHGVVIMHSLIMLMTTFTFYTFSKKLGLLNISVLLYFLLDLVTLHDNIIRQNLANILAMFAFWEALKDDEVWDSRRILKILAFVIPAFLFHYSAILIIPYCFLVVWFSRVKLNYWVVFPIVVIAGVIMYTGIVDKTLGVLFFFLSASQGDVSTYYMNTILDEDTHAGGILNLLMLMFATAPLFYFTYFRRERYENEKFLRLAVNLTWLVMTWKYLFISIVVLTRIADYLIWFAVWGYGYMLMDLYAEFRESLIKRMGLICMFVIISYNSYRMIMNYYGENTYLTIFSEECADMLLYDRDPENLDELRVR